MKTDKAIALSEDDDDKEQGIELSLGLSLNGKFGVNPKAKKLKRSISISNLISPVVERGYPWEWDGGCLPLARTFSLPVDSEEESMKRKEIQMLRRREAKRRRAQKLGNEGHQGLCWPPPLSQGSSGSSSTISELDSQTPPFSSGMNRSRSAEAKSPQSVQSAEENEHRSLPTNLSSEIDNVTGFAELRPSRSVSGTNEMVRNVLADMPYVSTKGDGQNGKRIEGFLYRYKNREEVRILCVCHGNFLTPAEFVKHAGGGDVEHPLRHIVVNSSSFL